MKEPPPSPRRIAVASHSTLKGAADLAAQIAAYIRDQDRTAQHASLYDDDLRRRVQSGDFELLVAIGGDGTMLRAGHLCAPVRVPVLGVNVGRLGFLIEVGREDWQSALERLFQRAYWLEERMMLRAEHCHDDALSGSWDVLNEAFIGRGEMVRPVRLIAEIDGDYLTTYMADGLIVATPTGSTAYALAAGGPILPPELRNVLLVPVAPHLSVDRAIVLHEGSWVRVTVRTDHQASLSIDGQEPLPLQDGDQVEVRVSPHVAHFVRFQEPDYFYRNLTSRMNSNPATGAEG